jgi:ATP-dependent RNA/DNA helicase IGHMBP2
MSFNSETYTAQLKQILELERKAQKQRYGQRIDQQNLKELKSSGAVLHPLKVLNRTFLADETPVVQFQILYDGASSLFKAGTPVRCFLENDTVDGQVVEFADKLIAVALRTEYFPDWIEERGVGLTLIPDEHTFDGMLEALVLLEESKNEQIRKHLSQLKRGAQTSQEFPLIYGNPELNASQNKAISGILQGTGIQIVHGPPGTGKTTTLTRAIHALVKQNKRILVSAPSNTAVDHCAKVLSRLGIKILRVGNHIKIDDEILPFTVDGYLSNAAEQKQIKSYQKQVDELRRKASQFKRVFDKAAREERTACYQEIKALRQEIKALRKFAINKVKGQCDVILGTPIGLRDELGKDFQADYVFIDEAGQCHDALAWLLASYAENLILTGDIHQLPPTYLAAENMRNPAATSMLHNVQQWIAKVHFLDTQYRMTPKIAGFSNGFFYGNRLIHHKSENSDEALLFYDTAGMGLDEKQVEDGASKWNEGEVELIERLLEAPENQQHTWAIISPYQGQVECLKSRLGARFRISTIDSFQGQESDGIILSLVRSNENQEIGFLKDYRRMNVALTRAQNRLIVIGDSATIGTDEFYGAFLDYCEGVRAYKSGFEVF